MEIVVFIVFVGLFGCVWLLMGLPLSGKPQPPARRQPRPGETWEAIYPLRWRSVDHYMTVEILAVTPHRVEFVGNYNVLPNNLQGKKNSMSLSLFLDSHHFKETAQ